MPATLAPLSTNTNMHAALTTTANRAEASCETVKRIKFSVKCRCP